MAGKKYYAVKNGRETGIFLSWDACKAQVQGYSGALYKGFATREEAELYLAESASGNKAAQYADCEQNFLQLSTGEMVAYVDGSFSVEKHCYAFGAVIFYAGVEHHFYGCGSEKSLVDMRNVAGEIMGAEHAITFALEQNAVLLHIYHDYEGIARWCTGEWQAKKSGTQAYRDCYLHAKASGLEILFHKVQGHSGDRYNELADTLAKSALGIR